jgi:HK97 family phage major capsid protein
MEGPGTATSPFTGVLNATSVNDAARTNGTNGVVLTYNTTASTKASLVQIYTAASERQPRNEGIWVCGPAVYAQIIGLVDSNGQPIVRFGAVEGTPSGMLLGRPIVVSARLPKTTVGAGTVSVGGLYFGPPNALLFGNRMGMRWDVTDQVSWATYQGDARMIGRFGYVVGVPTAWVKQTGIIV